MDTKILSGSGSGSAGLPGSDSLLLLTQEEGGAASPSVDSKQHRMSQQDWLVVTQHVCKWRSYHVAQAGEVVVEQALQGHPANRAVLVVAQAVVVHGKQVSSKGVVCNLDLHVIINTVKRGNEVTISRKNSKEGGCEPTVTTVGTMGPSGAHLHAIPGSQVFVYDLPAGQVAHSTSDLNGHIHQVLLGDRLKDRNVSSRATFQKPESIKGH